MIESNEITNIVLRKNRNVYLSILKAAKKYDCSKREEFLFDYSYNVDEIELFKEIHKLNALIGKNENETIKNATNWVSLILKSKKEPKGPIGNSVQIIQDIKSGKYAGNCYTYAVVLNDVLISLGFKSKYIFCFPIDFHFSDCHVVNVVFSKERNKWILLDAANNMIYTDEQGELLGLSELREYLINEIDVEIHLLDIYKDVTDMNKTLYKQKILAYMTKNTYRFGCFMNSQKDRQAVCKTTKFYNLVPVSYIDKPCEVAEYCFETKVKKIEYYSSNSQAFWKLPKYENKEDL